MTPMTAFGLSLLALLVLPNAGTILAARFYEHLRRMRLYASIAAVALLLAAMTVLFSYANQPLTGGPVFLWLSALSFMFLAPVMHDPYDTSPSW